MAVPYDELPVEVVRSTRRHKTIQARVVDGRIRVHVPASLGPAQVDAEVRRMVERLERRRRGRQGDVDLERLARDLCRRFDLPGPTSVRWVTNQRSRWGSCTTTTGEIRLSDRLRPWPRYVIEYVLVHELCHLVVADHSPAFYVLVDRYPGAERARGFLDAQSWGLDGQGPGGLGDDDPSPGPPTVPPVTS
jgi:predicted metal-dependent hydrolase